MRQFSVTRPGVRPAFTNTRATPHSRFTKFLPTGDVASNVPEFHPPMNVASPVSRKVSFPEAYGWTVPFASTNLKSTKAMSAPSASQPAGPVTVRATIFPSPANDATRCRAISFPDESRATTSATPDSVTSTFGNS